MVKIRAVCAAALRDRRASNAIEYSLIVALVVIMLIPIWQVIGDNVSTMFYGRALTAFDSAVNAI